LVMGTMRRWVGPYAIFLTRRCARWQLKVETLIRRTPNKP
jgi:hypothetical protein